jgi:hypothetical protein
MLTPTSNWQDLVTDCDAGPLWALDLTRRLYRDASPQEPPPSNAELSEDLRSLARQIAQGPVSVHAVLHLIWRLLLCL